MLKTEFITVDSFEPTSYIAINDAIENFRYPSIIALRIELKNSFL